MTLNQRLRLSARWGGDHWSQTRHPMAVRDERLPFPKRRRRTTDSWISVGEAPRAPHPSRRLCAAGPRGRGAPPLRTRPRVCQRSWSARGRIRPLVATPGRQFPAGWSHVGLVGTALNLTASSKPSEARHRGARPGRHPCAAGTASGTKRWFTTTAAPASAKPSAIPAPIPELAPRRERVGSRAESGSFGAPEVGAVRRGKGWAAGPWPERRTRNPAPRVTAPGAVRQAPATTAHRRSREDLGAWTVRARAKTDFARSDRCLRLKRSE